MNNQIPKSEKIARIIYAAAIIGFGFLILDKVAEHEDAEQKARVEARLSTAEQHPPLDKSRRPGETKAEHAQRVEAINSQLRAEAQRQAEAENARYAEEHARQVELTRRLAEAQRKDREQKRSNEVRRGIPANVDKAIAVGVRDIIVQFCMDSTNPTAADLRGYAGKRHWCELYSTSKPEFIAAHNNGQRGVKLCVQNASMLTFDECLLTFRDKLYPY